jgi:hypothetical protein
VRVKGRLLCCLLCSRGTHVSCDTPGRESSAMQKSAVLDHEGNPTEYRFQGNVANRALELIGKELGMFVERRKVETTDDLNNLSDAELLEIIAEERAAMARPGSIDQSRHDQFHAGRITK